LHPNYISSSRFICFSLSREKPAKLPRTLNPYIGSF
jgi:hypothetical protein